MTQTLRISNSLLAAWFILWLLLPAGQLSGQTPKVMPVVQGSAQPLRYPWAGGMNSMQFGNIDLNRDGLKDLLAFDRNGNRLMCFVNDGYYNTVSYTYRPDIAGLIPELNDWAVFRDYDNDGRTDIFTYSPGWAGMKVYRNISDNILKFDLVVYPYLETFQENGYVNLLVTNVDYPGIADIDFDGDLDILSFWGLGSFVNYHRNMSMEKYGIPDSLDFALEEYCWGYFAESEESNLLYYDTCFIGNRSTLSPAGDERHTGSTFLLLDLDNDTVMDLLLGDVDYPGLFALHNGGDSDEAFITSADTSFPSTTEKIRLFSFPVAEYIDVNNDMVKDLVVSSFEPSLETSANTRSVWYYKNTGGNNKPFFVLQQKDLLQSEMIDRGSGAYPVIQDWDGDGLPDLFVGNYGFYLYSYYENSFLRSVYGSRIAYYRNTGTAQEPAFQLWDDDFGGLDKPGRLGLTPTFADLDKDGDLDFLSGCEAGTLILVVNNDGEFEVVTENYQGIDVGDFSAPQLFDLDRDGLPDLVIGEKAGNLNYYRNVGSAGNPVFQQVTDSLGMVNVTDYNVSYDGYSVPWFFRPEGEETQLVVGSEQGRIFYFTGIDGNLEGAWTESDKLGELLDTTGVSFDRGARTAAAIGEITLDGRLEMVAGNFSGGMEYFNGQAQVVPSIREYRDCCGRLDIHPNPAIDFIEVFGNGLETPLELSIRNMNGQLLLYRRVSEMPPGKIRINTSDLKRGLYLVRAVTGKGVFVGKLVIR